MNDGPQPTASRPAVPYSAAIAGQLPVQAELIPIEELDDGFWRAEECTGRYTARRFFLKRPDAYQQCIQLLAAGAGLLKIARLLGVHHRTVAAVRDSEGEQIDIAKQRIRSNLRLAAEVGAERMPEVLAELPNSQLPVGLAITLDKLAQLDGEPTQRVEITLKGKLTHEAVAAAIEQFPEAEEADFTITDSGAGESGQKGLPAAAAAPSIKPGSAPAVTSPKAGDV